MFNQRREPIVSVDWLADHINNSKLIIVDVSQESKPAIAGLENKCIPKSIKASLKDFSDATSDYPNTLLSPEDFEKVVREMGVDDDSCLVFYDNQGVYWSPRFWWMFKVMGFDHVFVLNGGLPAWNESDFKLSDEHRTPKKKGNFEASFQEDYFRSFEQITENLTNKEELILDARSKGRFEGVEPEPRTDIASGCIPNSMNLPYTDVIENFRFKKRPVLEQMFAHLDQEQPLVFSCGSGVTACIILIASILADFPMGAVYDGSWTEWAIKNNQ